MDVIGHHNRHIERHLNVVVMQAAVLHDLSGEVRQNPPLMSAERYKMRPIIALQMRQLTPVKSLAHLSTRPVKCGDSRPRLSGGAQLRYCPRILRQELWRAY